MKKRDKNGIFKNSALFNATFPPNQILDTQPFSQIEI